MLKIIITISTLLFFINCFCQKEIVQGKIVDKVSKAALSNTTIYINGQRFISDNYGSFICPIKQQKGDSIFVKIKHIGFKDFILTYKDIPFLYVELERQQANLPEVFVFTGGRRIIEKAISRISENYYANPIITGIQQTYELINDSSYLLVDTAIVCYQFKNNFSQKPNISLRLLQNSTRVVNNFDSTFNNFDSINWSGVYTVSPKDDPIYNSAISFINPKYFDETEYTLRSKEIINDRSNYVIGYKCFKKKIVTSEGTIYIDSASFAFTKFSSIMNEDYLRRRRETINSNIYIRTYSFLEINYTCDTANKWVLRNLHIEQKIIRPSKVDENNTYTITSDFVNTKNGINLNIDSLLNYKNELRKLGRLRILDLKTKEQLLDNSTILNLIQKEKLSDYFTDVPLINKKSYQIKGKTK